MEQTRAQAKIDELKNQYEMVDDAHLAKMYSEAKRDIEHHFEALFNSILERKEALLKSLESSFTFLKTKAVEEQQQLKSKIEKASKALDVGLSLLTVSKDAANSILQGVDLISHQQQEIQLLTILPSSLFTMIATHGSIFPQPLQNPQVKTLAGSSEGCNDGVGEQVKFNMPSGVVFNPDDNCLYVCDYGNDMIRKVTLNGQVSVFCKASYPFDITYNRQRKLFYVTSVDANTIHQISYEGIISPFAGVATNTLFGLPTGITINPQTNDVYVSENGSHTIRKITQQGIVSTLAGSTNKSGYLDGMKEKAQFICPVGLVYHAKEQVLIVCDHGNGCLRRITMDGKVTTLHKVHKPRFISLLTNDIALVSSSSTNRIFKVQLSDVNKVEVFAGKEEKGNKDGPVLESQFDWPNGMTIDHATNTCFVVDRNNHTLRKIV